MADSVGYDLIQAQIQPQSSGSLEIGMGVDSLSTPADAVVFLGLTDFLAIERPFARSAENTLNFQSRKNPETYPSSTHGRRYAQGTCPLLLPHNVFRIHDLRCLIERRVIVLPGRGTTFAAFLWHKMDIVRNDPDPALGLAVLLPAVLPEAPLNNDAASLFKILGAVLGNNAPHLNVKVGHLRDLLAGLGIHAVIGDR